MMCTVALFAHKGLGDEALAAASQGADAFTKFLQDHLPFMCDVASEGGGSSTESSGG